MAYMTAAIARNVAESMWGTGGSSAAKTNRKCVYYFDCAGHGGYVLPASALSKAEYDAVTQYVKPEVAKVYVSCVNGKIVYMHPHRTRSSRILSPWNIIEEEYFIFEEDCDWVVLEKFTDIRLKEVPNREKLIEDIFWNWHDTNNPVVTNRVEVDEKRKNGDPDLIVSAYGSPETEVVTADGNKYVVTGYNKNARDKFDVPYLSLCEKVIRKV